MIFLNLLNYNLRRLQTSGSVCCCLVQLLMLMLQAAVVPTVMVGAMITLPS